MNQGGYGGGNVGGGYGPPQGGPPPGGGYGPPQGGPPPGGGWGPPPGGPGPNLAPPGAGGAGRFVKTAILGGLIGGVLSAIPLLSVANCCCCLFNLLGAWLGVRMYLNANPGENISGGEAATSGAISGVVTGLISSVAGLVTSIVMGHTLAKFLQSLPNHQQMAPAIAQLTHPSVGGLVVSPVLYAAFGALGGYGGLTLFHKDRVRAT